jgi:N-acetylmuramoyl-L-alanine amidase
MCKEETPVEDNNKPSPWAKEAWEKAVKKGITDGTRPKDTATREEVILMLARAGVI